MAHEDTLRSYNSPIHWQHYAHVQAKTKDLEVTKRDRQVKHLLGCVVPGLQDIAQKAVPSYFAVAKQPSTSALI